MVQSLLTQTVLLSLGVLAEGQNRREDSVLVTADLDRQYRLSTRPIRPYGPDLLPTLRRQRRSLRQQPLRLFPGVSAGGEGSRFVAHFGRSALTQSYHWKSSMVSNLFPIVICSRRVAKTELILPVTTTTYLTFIKQVILRFPGDFRFLHTTLPSSPSYHANTQLAHSSFSR